MMSRKAVATLRPILIFLACSLPHAAAGGPPSESFECEISTIARDFYDKAPEHFFTCRDNDGAGEEFDLDVSGVSGWQAHTGDRATIQGNRVANPGKGKIKVTDFQMKGKAGGRREAAYTGTRTAAVLMIRFVEGNAFYPATYDVAARSAMAQTVNQTLYGEFDKDVRKTHAGTWDECSYGKLKLGFDTDGIANDFAADYPGEGSGADIFYVDIPYKCTDGVGDCVGNYDTAASCSSAEYYGWPRTAFKALGSRVNKADWQHWIVIFPKGTGVSCNFVGMGNVGCSGSYCYTWIPTSYAHQAQDYTHELGHNIHLHHAGSALSSGNGLEYGDMSCAMGYCCSVRCYNAPHAYELGWLNPSAEFSSANLVAQVPVESTLKSMSLHDDGAIVVSNDWGDGQTYWLQLKTAHSYDKFMNSGWRNNVQIKRWNKGTYERSDHVHTFSTTPGDSWTDPSGKLIIQMVSIDVAGTQTAVVKIIRNEGVDPCLNVVCQAIDECHEAGVCTDGVCSNPISQGTSCSMGLSPCEEGQCQADGSCLNVGPTVCAPIDTCHGEGTCNVLTGLCEDGPLDLCCNVVCNPIDECHEPGTCNASTGQCEAGPANPDPCCGVVCDAIDECHAPGVCEVINGQASCPNPNVADGTTCTSGISLCEEGQCVAGACTVQGVKVCAPIDECHEPGTCNALTGQCEAGPVDPCCGVVCQAIDECHAPGVCEVIDGQAVCPNPNIADGTTCTSGISLCEEGQCVAGACSVQGVKFCAPIDECHGEGTCDDFTGQCLAGPQTECLKCGDNICDADAGENCQTCQADCGPERVESSAFCGDGVCNGAEGENCVTCPNDCSGKTWGNPKGQYCCGGGDEGTGCGETQCTNTNVCSMDPAPVIKSCCGDHTCTPSLEDNGNCPADCLAASLQGGAGTPSSNMNRITTTAWGQDVNAGATSASNDASSKAEAALLVSVAVAAVVGTTLLAASVFAIVRALKRKPMRDVESLVVGRYPGKADLVLSRPQDDGTSEETPVKQEYPNFEKLSMSEPLPRQPTDGLA